MPKIWGYQKDKGRFYRRTTGTVRFPDSGSVSTSPLGKEINKEKIGLHKYGQDRGKLKKDVSKVYRQHTFRGKRGKISSRGGYKRRLR